MNEKNYTLLEGATLLSAGLVGMVDYIILGVYGVIFFYLPIAVGYAMFWIGLVLVSVGVLRQYSSFKTTGQVQINPGETPTKYLRNLIFGILSISVGIILIILTLLFVNLVTFPLNVIWGHAIIPVEIAILGEGVIFLTIYFFPYKYNIGKVWN